MFFLAINQHIGDDKRNNILQNYRSSKKSNRREQECFSSITQSKLANVNYEPLWRREKIYLSSRNAVTLAPSICSNRMMSFARFLYTL